MGKRQTYSVPFITETTDIWLVEAGTKAEATMVATIKRERWRGAETPEEAAKSAPSNSHISSFKLGTIATPVEEPDA